MAHVPYKSGPQAMNDVVAGHVQMMFADPGSALPQVREGKVRALGVTSLVPLPSAPDILPLSEAGVPKFEAVSWQMIVAPANTPSDIVSMRVHPSAFVSSATRKSRGPLIPCH
jgi:tripartite-type tricarboxylate transporter receptor subunit TctC